MRSHRAFRQLTTLLNRAGVAVFRFDYYGTGDSGGLSEDVSVDEWVENVHTACEELKDTAALSMVSLIGLRFGATLATLAAQTREDIDRIVLWDPIVNGSEYITEMVEMHAPVLVGQQDSNWGGQVVGVCGFPLTPDHRSDMAKIDLATIQNFSTKDLDVVGSQSRPNYTRLAEAWTHASLPAHLDIVPSQGNWSEDDKFGSALIPQAIIQAIVGKFL